MQKSSRNLDYFRGHGQIPPHTKGIPTEGRSDAAPELPGPKRGSRRRERMFPGPEPGYSRFLRRTAQPWIGGQRWLWIRVTRRGPWCHPLLVSPPCPPSPGCPTEWDGVSCWPALPLGQSRAVACPDILNVFKKSKGLNPAGIAHPMGPTHAARDPCATPALTPQLLPLQNKCRRCKLQPRQGAGKAEIQQLPQQDPNPFIPLWVEHLGTSSSILGTPEQCPCCSVSSFPTHHSHAPELSPSPLEGWEEEFPPRAFQHFHSL